MGTGFPRVGQTARRGHALIVGAGLLAAGVLAAVATPASAGAFPFPRPEVLWVSTTGAAGAADVSCATAAYSSIQAAVTAAEAQAPGTPFSLPTIEVCPGTYAEQVTITASLDLARAPVAQSEGPAVIELPAAVGANQSTGLSTTSCQLADATDGIQVPQSVIEICGAGASGTGAPGTNVGISDLTIEGSWPGSVCYDSLYDVLVGGGASLDLSGSTVEQAGAYPLNGCQGGVGVEVGFAPTGEVGHATLEDDVVTSYQKNGITVDGAGSSATIVGTTVTGDGPTAQIAQNGIQISNGATGTVSSSRVSGNNYTGANEASSTGILLFGGCGSPLVTHARISGNVLTNNDVGVYLGNFNAACSAAVTTPTDDSASANAISDSSGYPDGVASPDANISGFGPDGALAAGQTEGYQAGIADVGDGDVLTANAISGAGYAPLGATSSLPNPPPPAFVRPIDLVSIVPVAPVVFANTFDGAPYDGGATPPSWRPLPRPFGWADGAHWGRFAF